MKVLITSGGTREPIDGVRYIGNSSTGLTGTVIAEVFAENGAEVVYLHAVDAIKPNVDLYCIPFVTFEDISDELRTLLTHETFDCVIHAAAVSDYSIDSIWSDDKEIQTSIDSKISSEGNISIKLRKNPKLLDLLREYSQNKDVTIVGFKLTNADNLEEQENIALEAAQNPHVEFLVHNDLNDISETHHLAQIMMKDGTSHKVDTKKELADKLFELIGDEK